MKKEADWDNGEKLGLPVKVRDQRTGQITLRATRQYVATFNHGKIEETFYALNDTHASEVAHEIAARRRLMYDAVKPVETKEEISAAECAPQGHCIRD